jgi:hypothetical protein
MLADVRYADAAVTLTANLANALMAVKRQVVLPIVTNFEDLLARHRAWEATVADYGLEVAGEFTFDPLAQTVRPPETAIGDLAELIRENAGADPVASMAFHALRQLVANICYMLEDRNEILVEMRGLFTEDQHMRAIDLFLGLQLADGSTDARHAQIMQQLPDQMNEALGMAVALAEHLSTYAKASASRFGKRAPDVRSADFREAEALELLPDLKPFRDKVARLRGVNVVKPQ